MIETFVNLVNALRSSSSSNFKKEAIASCANDGMTRSLLYYTYNPYYNYYITKPVVKCTGNVVRFDSNHFNAFTDLLDLVNARHLTSRQFAAKLQDLLENFDPEIVDILIQVVKRDLKAGINVKTINEAIPDLVPHFSVMLAGKLTDDKIDSLPFPITISPKYDGYRGLAKMRFNLYDMLSREGRVLDTYTAYFQEKLQYLNLNFENSNAIFDGEIKSIDYKGTSVAKGKSNSKKDLKFFIFDYLTDEDSNKIYIQRITDLHNLKTLIKEDENLRDHFEVILPRVVRNPEELKAAHYANLELKFEGSMLKTLYHKYVWERSPDWLKYKPFIEVDGYILEVLEGEEDGKYVGTMGSIVVGGEDENGNKFKVNCGSGFSDKQRDELWAVRNTLINAKVMLEAQEFSQDKDGNWSLRFPVFGKFKTI